VCSALPGARKNTHYAELGIRVIYTYDQDYWNGFANRYSENDHNMVLKSYKRRYDGDEKSRRRAYEYDFLREMQR